VRAAAALLLLTACDGEKPRSEGVCVFNQAYQETFAPDGPAQLDRARGCYVLLDPDEGSVTARIPELHAQGNTVGCYTSVGTCEDWRDDFDAARGSCVDEQWGEWAGEYFVDTPDPALLAVMEARLDRFAELGCDWVELDNMDWAYDPENVDQYGVSASESEAEDYVGAVCAAARERGLECMAKSTTRGVSTPAGATFESYPGDKSWWEDRELQAVLDGGGLGVVVHYNEDDCDGVFEWYLDRYGDRLSFLCEDREARAYRHYNR
jgi:hypothetical protein